MSPSTKPFRQGSALLVLATVALPGLGHGAEEKPPPLEVLAAAQHGTVTQFAMAVARTRTPIGVYLLDREYDLGTYIEPSVLRPTSLPSEALTLFAASNPEYRGEEARAAAVLIASKQRTPCEAMSRRNRQDFVGNGSAFEVLYQIFRTWANDQGPYLPPGLLGNEDRETYLAEVSVNVANSTLEDALYALVEQVPGLGWSIKEERGMSFSPAGEQRGCSLGLFTGRSWLLMDWVVPDSQSK